MGTPLKESFAKWLCDERPRASTPWSAACSLSASQKQTLTNEMLAATLKALGSDADALGKMCKASAYSAKRNFIASETKHFMKLLPGHLQDDISPFFVVYRTGTLNKESAERLGLPVPSSVASSSDGAACSSNAALDPPALSCGASSSAGVANSSTAAPQKAVPIAPEPPAKKSKTLL
jgi:hypothetical protein